MKSDEIEFPTLVLQDGKKTIKEEIRLIDKKIKTIDSEKSEYILNEKTKNKVKFEQAEAKQSLSIKNSIVSSYNDISKIKSGKKEKRCN